MPKNNKNSTPKEKNTTSGNRLENYFCSPEGSKKRKSTSMEPSNRTSPPAKKMDVEKEDLMNDSKPQDRSAQVKGTPTSDKVCKHLDTQLNEMEKRLETSLTASLSASITANVTAGLKDLIDSSLKNALETMKKSVDEAIEENPTVKMHGEQIDSLETENIILKNKVNKIEGENKQIKQRLTNIECKSLQHNLLFRGVPEEQWEKETTTRHKVYVELINLISAEDTPEAKLKMAKKLEIRSCKRLGRYSQGKSRPISAEFVRKDDVDYILSNKTNLRGGVYADKEYPLDIEKKRKILRPIYTAAKQSKKYKKRCRMENDQLVIKGKHYSIEDMDKLPRSLKPVNVTSKSNDTVFGYFGELNPLSNFHPAKFSIEDKTFHCSEQYIQWKKAELFKDHATMKKIEGAKTGHQCKEAGKLVSNYKKEVWDRRAQDLCKQGIRQKFVENKIPRDVLLIKTSGKRIVECTKETPWGCGFPLKDDNCLIPTKWTSQGIMGSMLEAIRQELSSNQYLPQKSSSCGNNRMEASSLTTALRPGIILAPSPSSSATRNDGNEDNTNNQSSIMSSESSSSDDE